MKVKRIGIDARLYSQTGVGTYLRNLLHYLPEMVPAGMQFYIYLLPDDQKKVQLPPEHFIIRETDAKWHTLREQIVFYDQLVADDLDLMHFTYFSYPVRYKMPFIATVHDLTPLLFKTGRASTLNPLLYECKYQAFKFVLSQQIKHAKHIITPTQAVKDQIVGQFGKTLEKKIVPLLEGVNYELVQAIENASLQKQFHFPFYLYVGNFYPHKNVDRLLEAFATVHEAQHLILVGPDNMFAQQLKRQVKQENIAHIHFFHDATIEDLAFFYKHAQALVNPSLSEGFGLPLIEATYFGCPVIASDIPVFKELLGDHFTSFDPTDVVDIGEKLRVTSHELRSEETVKERFSFEKMTRKIVEIYTNP